ncbi:MAG: response regulator transcription factor [Phycisphaerales bacterium]|nr:response regulator transcription factor [Phycisphaerales bacterium]
MPRSAQRSSEDPRDGHGDARDRADPLDGGVRVLCVDDHAVLVEGLKAQFAIDGRIHVVGRLASADKLVEEVGRVKPDVVMLDIEMPGPDVFESAERMRDQYPAIRFIFLSAHIRDGYLAAAYKCGAWGYFAKGDELDDIVAGIRQIAASPAGIFVMGPKVRQRCTQPAAHHHHNHEPRSDGPTDSPLPATHLEQLTAREIEILRLIGRGLSRNQIAAELSRSAKTVDGHQERIMKKLEVKSRSDLMRFAIREGLAEP